MKKSFLSFFSAAPLLVSSAFTRADVVAYYPVTQTGVSRDYFLFACTAEDGSFVPLTGEQIVSANLTIDYTPAPGEDINNLFIGMAVPTEADEQFFGVMGTDFTLTSPGHYHYDLTTDVFNGTIRSGAFGIETYSLIDGEGQGTDGQYLEGSGFRYTVATVGTIRRLCAELGISAGRSSRSSCLLVAILAWFSRAATPRLDFGSRPVHPVAMADWLLAAILILSALLAISWMAGKAD